MKKEAGLRSTENVLEKEKEEDISLFVP